MVIISKRVLNEYISSNPGVKDALLRWYEIAKAADWRNFNALKNDFRSADVVGNDLYVFNLGGNKYRLIVRIIFRARTIFIRFVGTHKEYDQIDLGKL